MSVTYRLNQTYIQSKLDKKGASGILVGFNPQLLSYKIINSTGKIINTKHVIFNNQKPIKISNKHNPIELPKIIEVTPPNTSPTQEICKIKDESHSETPEIKSDNSSVCEFLFKCDLPPTLQNQEKLSKMDQYGFFSDKTPKSLEEAMQIPHWEESAAKAFATTADQDVGEEVDNDEITNPLNTVTLFKIKLNSNCILKPTKPKYALKDSVKDTVLITLERMHPLV